MVVVRITEDANCKRLGCDAGSKGQGSRGRNVIEAGGRAPASRLIMDRDPPAGSHRPRDRDDGVSRLVVSLDSGKADTILPELDRWATLIRQLDG